MRLKKHYKTLLVERNVINVDAIDGYISDFIKRNRASARWKKWMTTVYRKHMINQSYATEIEHDDLTDDQYRSNKWLKKAVTRGEKIYVVRNLGDEQTLRHWMDWMDQADVRDVTRMSMSAVMEAVMRWDAEMKSRQKLEREVGKTKEIEKLPGGLTLYRLMDQKALAYEGSHMGHCVAGYSIGDYVDEDDGIFSIRDKQNKPHVTIEASYAQIVQVKGKENKPPVDKYMPAVSKAIKTLGFSFPERTRSEEGILIDKSGKYVSLLDMPEGTKLSDRITVSAMMTGWTGDMTIPKRTSAPELLAQGAGTVTIEAGCEFTSMSCTDKVQNMIIKDCKASGLYAQAPANKLDASGCKFRRVKLSAGGMSDLTFTDCEAKSVEIQGKQGTEAFFKGGYVEELSVMGGEVVFAGGAGEIEINYGDSTKWEFAAGAEVSVMHVLRPSRRLEFTGGSYGYVLFSGLSSIKNAELSSKAEFGHIGYSDCTCEDVVSYGKVELLEFERDNERIDLTILKGDIKELKIDYVPKDGSRCVTVGAAAKVRKVTGRGKDYVSFI